MLNGVIWLAYKVLIQYANHDFQYLLCYIYTTWLAQKNICRGLTAFEELIFDGHPTAFGAHAECVTMVQMGLTGGAVYK